MTEVLEARLAKLESKIKYLTYMMPVFLSLGVLIACLALILSRSSSVERVAAREFAVVDDKGHQRATFGLTNKNEPLLTLDADGKQVMASVRKEGQPFLILGDSNSHRYISIYGPTSTSESSVDFTWDAKHVMELRVSREGAPSVELRDKEGKTMWKSP